MAKKRVFAAFKKDFKDVPMKECKVRGKSFLLYRVRDAFYATENLCTHEGIPLADGELKGNVVTCPMHGAQFDVTTGKVKALPAVVPLKTYPVETEGNKIFVMLEGE